MEKLNDHTDAEIARREHDLEMGGVTQGEQEWLAWLNKAEGLLGLKSLDGDQAEDGYSLDFAHDAFSEGKSAEEYVASLEPQFIGYRIGGNGDGVPIVVGDNLADVFGKTAQRTLASGAVGPYDQIAVRVLIGPKKLKPEDLAELRGIVDGLFAEKGIQ